MDMAHRLNNTDRGNPKYSEKFCDNANLLTINPTQTDLALDVCRYVVFLDFFTVILFADLKKNMCLFFKQLKFISCFFHILASQCFILEDQAVVDVTLNTLTEATCIDTIK
jgi:hypothetical protein